MKTVIQQLCELPGVSGREEAVRQFILKSLSHSSAEMSVTVDSLGNVICHLKGDKRAEKQVMLSAHMDEVGLIVTHITEDGYLRFATVGGITDAVLCGTRVKIGDISGVIGCKAFHLCSKDEAKKQPPQEELLIDIGAESKEKAAALVCVGDAAVFDTPFTEMQTQICAKALDDRVGCALLLEIAQKTPPYDITLAFTVQEEVGCRGAAVVAFSVRPDIAIVLETTTAADIANVSEDRQVCKIGNGPVVSFMDKGTLYDAELYRLIRKTADDLHIPNQTKTLIAGGNDASAIQRSANGVRVGAISLPCRYIHSPSSVISYEDLLQTRLLVLGLLGVLPI